ncbi:MAG: hypothetical protein J6L73_07490 [Muribaculaceae bacterium]|nr:hypothetical protein [Muribaculaceae bacterium]
MSKTAQYLVSALVIFLFIIIFGAIVGIRTDNGNSTPGIFGLIVFAGLIGALRAIWKSKSSDNDDSNKTTLQK